MVQHRAWSDARLRDITRADNIYSEHIMRCVLEEHHDGITIGGRRDTNLRFADDTIMLCICNDELLALLKRVKEAIKSQNLWESVSHATITARRLFTTTTDSSAKSSLTYMHLYEQDPFAAYTVTAGYELAQALTVEQRKTSQTLIENTQT